MEPTHRERCTCAACRRYDDEDVISLTPAGLALLEQLAAADRQGRTFTDEEADRWVLGFQHANRPGPETHD